MLFSLAMEAGCGRAEGVVGFGPTREERCLPAPGVWRTRHPRKGAAERRTALLVNFLTSHNLENLGRCRALSVNFLTLRNLENLGR